MNRTSLILIVLILAPLTPSATAETEIIDITQEAESGTYMEPGTKDLYYYDALTNTLAPTGTKGGPEENSMEQAGDCTYVNGNWDDSGSTYTYGKCISLRNLGDGRVLYRINVQELAGDVYQAWLSMDWLDQNESRLGSSNLTGFSCGSGSLVRSCHFDENNPRTLDLDGEVHDIPADAASYCPSLMLGSMDSYGNLTPLLKVEGSCSSLPAG